MHSISQIHPMLRAIGVIGAVAALVTGVTFAVHSSSATLTQNTISSVAGQLLVQSGGAFASQDSGFDFENVEPGGGPTPTSPFGFNLRNESATNFEVTAYVPDAPTTSVDGSPGEVDLTLVNLLVTCTSGDTTQTFALPASTSLQELIDAEPGGVELAGGFLPANSDAACQAQAEIEPGAFTGGNADIGNFNIVFNAYALREDGSRANGQDDIVEPTAG